MSEAVRYTRDQDFVSLKDAHNVTKGAGVFVGIIDTGVSILHTAFKLPNQPSKTRIAWLWVPHGAQQSGSSPLWDRWGTVFDEAKINQILAKVVSGRSVESALVELSLATAATADMLAQKLKDIDPTDKQGHSYHGTMIASIAAGTPWRSWDADGRAPEAAGPRIGGVAPEAKLIVVALADSDQSLSEKVLAGAEFCFDKAGATPCVVNLSVAETAEPHNGLSNFFDKLGPRLRERPGRAFVAAAGNTGNKYKHMLLDGPRLVKLRVMQGMALDFKLLISSDSHVDVEIAPPVPYTNWAPLTPGSYPSFNSSDEYDGHKIKFDYYAPRGQGDGQLHRIIHVIATKGTVSPDDWLLDFKNNVKGIHVWLDSESAPQNASYAKLTPFDPWDESREDISDDSKSTGWRRSAKSIQYSLSKYACGNDVVAVGYFGTQTKFPYWKMLVGTSRGPTTDAARHDSNAKPDIAAPGENIRAALWEANRRAGPMGLSKSWSKATGSSAAAPFVSGAVALMLSRKPTLTHDQIRQIIRTHRQEVKPGLAELMQVNSEIRVQDAYGEGFLNIKSALDGTPP